jgi:hypothetical protein
MKIDDHLILLKGQAATGPSPRRPQKDSAQKTCSGVILLISQENQRAWRLRPKSLEEAKKILGLVQEQMARMPEDSLAEVHRLDDQCLVRLR